MSARNELKRQFSWPRFPLQRFHISSVRARIGVKRAEQYQMVSFSDILISRNANSAFWNRTGIFIIRHSQTLLKSSKSSFLYCETSVAWHLECTANEVSKTSGQCHRKSNLMQNDPFRLALCLRKKIHCFETNEMFGGTADIWWFRRCCPSNWIYHSQHNGFQRFILLLIEWKSFRKCKTAGGARKSEWVFCFSQRTFISAHRGQRPPKKFEQTTAMLFV